MKNFDEFINSQNDLPVLVKLAIQHYQFESIHPFYDGNGRTGRIVNVLHLMLNNLLDSPILYLSGYIIKHKPAYYRLLQEVRVKDKWEEWILFILRGVEQTSLETIDKSNRINALFNQTLVIAKKKSPRVYSKELIEHLFVHPYTKIEYILSALQVDRKTATKHLKEIKKVGILKSEQKWKEVIYVNTKLYELLRK